MSWDSYETEDIAVAVTPENMVSLTVGDGHVVLIFTPNQAAHLASNLLNGVSEARWNVASEVMEKRDGAHKS